MIKRTLLVITILIFAFLALGEKAYAFNQKFFIQWAQSNPGDWQLSDVDKWPNIQTKSDPVGDTTDSVNRGDSQLNAQKGWILAINIQGVEFAWYDHYHVLDLTDGSGATRVIAWIDDLSTATGYTLRRADVGTFAPLAFDPKVGGTNTVQTFIWYREGSEYDALLASGVPENVTLSQYSNFVAPTTDIKHGIYTSDATFDLHVAARTQKGWRDWVGL